MGISKCLVSTCRHCRYYELEGRRGGQCHQLGAPVQGFWKACSLAIPPFAPSWEGVEQSLDDLELWAKDMRLIPEVFQASSPASPQAAVGAQSTSTFDPLSSRRARALVPMPPV